MKKGFLPLLTFLLLMTVEGKLYGIYSHVFPFFSAFFDKHLSRSFLPKRLTGA